VNVLEFIFAPLEPSKILLLTVLFIFFFELSNFSFQAFPTYVAEMFTILSCIVQLISFNLA